MADVGRSAQDARQELYEVMDLELPFEEKAERALAVGERYLGVDHAYLARIDPDADYWRAVVSTDAGDEAVLPEPTIDLGTAYCRRTIGDEGPIALHDVPAQGWGDDPAFEAHGLHCYHGATVAPGGSLYGTVCFASEEPRERPFAEAETMFVELLARLLERELERDRTGARLDRFEEFASVLSHDLRNPLNVAQGRLELERRERDTENLAVAARSLDRIEALIESVLDIAREGAAVEQTAVVSLSSVAEESWLAVDTDAASLEVESDLGFRADPDRLRRVFENLFRNAVEHGSTSPRSERREDAGEHGSTSPRSERHEDAGEHTGAAVTIRVGALDGAPGFYVEDDGPGIPPEDREVAFEVGYTTSTDGTGLGLSIVESIVEAHGWEIDVTESHTGGARFEVSGVIPA